MAPGGDHGRMSTVPLAASPRISWAEHFLREKHVAVAPGSAFGSAGEGWIRVCLAATRDDLIAGLSRLPDHP